MPWNWEMRDWPQFDYDQDLIIQLERQFLLGEGEASAYLKTIDSQEYHQFIIEILSREGLESSKIEGEILDRESLQSSIKQQFGLKKRLKSGGDKESRMAGILVDVYESFDQPLTHEMLWQWHSMLFQGISHISESGAYRTHAEPMQIVSNRFDIQRVFFEAPPSRKVKAEMTAFIEWFNSSAGSGSILGRAAIGHLYFESIHPFEDGNGRIGRVLVEKILSQGVGRPVLIAISKMLEKRKKEYYSALERCNQTLDAQHWVEFFGAVILQAHEESMSLLYFLIAKSKIPKLPPF
jgi:Fic family protein